MLGSSIYVGELANRYPSLPITELTPFYRNLYFKDIIIDNCKVFIKAIGLPESPIENITFEKIKCNNKEMIFQDIGKFVFK